MTESEVLHLEPNYIPVILKWVFGFLYYCYAVYIAFLTLFLIIFLFNESWKTGLALFLTGIGEMIYFIPVGVAFGGLTIATSWTENVKNKWEFWIKLIAGYILAIIIPYLILMLVSLFTGFVISL